MQQNRTTQRKLVGLLVKLAHKGLDEFASKYATNLSDGGMFIRTREPKPIGTELSFKVEIADGQRVLQGTAVVRWTRPDNDPGGPPGMGLEFLTLDPASRALVDRMMGHAAAVAPPSIAPAVSPFPDEDEPFTMTAPVQAGAPLAPAVPSIAPLAPPAIAPATAPRVAPAVVAPRAPHAVTPLAAQARAAAPGPAAPHVGAPLAHAAFTGAPAVPRAAAPTGAPVVPHASAPRAPAAFPGAPAAPNAGAPVVPHAGAPVASAAFPGAPAVPHAGAPVVPHAGAPVVPHAGAPVVPHAGAPVVPHAGSPAAFPGAPAVPHAGAPVVAHADARGAPVARHATPAPPVSSLAPPAGGEMEFELPIDDSDLFSASAEVDPERAVEVDLDVLLGSTPAAVPITSSDSGIAIDLEPLEQAEPLPSTPLDVPALPTIRRAPATPAPAPAAAPVVLDAKAAAPAPAPQQAGPVYLRDVKVAETTGPVIGIDLGTTNSACAVLTKGRPIILSSKDGYNTIPSVVALTAQNRLLIGHRAKSQLVLNPTQSIFGAKRLVGREFDSPTVKQVKERSHYEIVPGADRRAAVRLGDKVLSLEEVQALVLKECREMAEQALGVPVSRAVITCPAYYSEPQREAVRRAGAMAGLKVERVLNEPTAAALAFGMGRELKKTVLVYDLGGGTFDATLLKVDQNVFEVLATGGDVFLGGTDFDNQVVDLLLRRFQEWHKRPFSGDRVALSRVTEVAEKVKIALSEQKSFDVHLPMLEMDGSGKPLDLRTTVTRSELEDACRELVDRTLQAVQDVLLDAKLKATQIDEIILVGGMSRMPLVRERLKELFKKPAHASVNADEAVALGAALYSGTVDKVSSLVLIDVVPMTIGLGRPGGAFHRLIERNTPLPATKSFGLSTQKDDETELEVMVFQGEDSNVAGNEFLGAVTISGLPKGPKGSVQVAVTLGLDAECVLRVEAREFKTRQVVRATLATRYTTEEIAQRLGITAEKREAVNKSRTEELEKRAGGFWGKLKSLFNR